MFNLAVTFIAAALLAPSAAVGQTLSACVSNCTELALPAGNCAAVTDLACVCTSTDFLSSASACITQDCPAELDGAIAAQAAACSQYTNGTDTGSTSDAGAGSSSSSASASSSPAVVTPGGTTTRATVVPGTTTRPASSSSSSRPASSTSTASTGAGFHTASIASGVTLALFGAAFSLF